ncbi:carbohydrate ABC transporter permease [Streptomyces flaveolus]|uniref:carbohydrate ABC transporter permease n=1 Tax=Streptomyces flaveolus TaxID=67297 RepID=UPI0033EFCFDA
MTQTLDAPAVSRAPAPPAARKGPRKDRKSVIATAFLLAFFCYFLVPFFWLLVSATKSNGDLFDSFGFWFSGQFHLFDNIRELFAYSDGVFWHWLANSAWYAIAGALGAALLATSAGYGFAKFAFFGRSGMFTLILGTIAVPTTALAIPTYLMFSEAGLTDTPWAVILPSLVNPIGIYLMRAYVADSVPDEVLEAGRIDGASEARIFFRIALPMTVPGFTTVFLFSLVSTWKNYFLPLVMISDPRWYPVTVGLAQMNATANAGGGSQALFSVVITGALISIVPLVIAFLLLQRFWQSGLSAGAVK